MAGWPLLCAAQGFLLLSVERCASVAMGGSMCTCMVSSVPSALCQVCWTPCVLSYTVATPTVPCLLVNTLCCNGIFCFVSTSLGHLIKEGLRKCSACGCWLLPQLRLSPVLGPTAVHGTLHSRGTCTMVLLGSLPCHWQFFLDLGC